MSIISKKLKTLLWTVPAAAFLLFAGCQDRPDALLERSRNAVNNAASASAAQFSEADFRKAESLLQEGWLEMAHQNGRLAPLRDYARAESLLVSAAILADRAAENSRAKLADMRLQVRNRSKALSDELASWRTALNGTLTRYDAERYWSDADIALKTSRSLFDEEQYPEALSAIRRGQDALDALSRLASSRADDESQKMQTWRRWADETLAQSRRTGANAVVVDKSSHRLYLIRNGKPALFYDCELGYNSAGQKLFAGDGATPEGRYRVTQKRMQGSKYYRALMLDYPNQNDRKRFADNQARGIISAQAHIGGLIEIHGEGGRNSDWTDGCVALKNGDMDDLMKHVAVGTPVTIVRKLEQWP